VTSELDKDGIIDFSIEAKGDDLPGHKIFENMMNHYGEHAKGIRGNWSNTTKEENNKNLGVVNKLTRRGVPIEEAIKKTFTYREAMRFGFSRVRIEVPPTGKPGEYTRVQVLFERKDKNK
jgi:hypothetical protein